MMLNQKNIYNSSNNQQNYIRVNFKEGTGTIMIQFKLDDKVSSMREKYRNKSGDFDMIKNLFSMQKIWIIN